MQGEFQSLVGKLETPLRFIKESLKSPFQSLVGKLETKNPRKHKAKGIEFQSLVGKLETFSSNPLQSNTYNVSIPCR